MDDGGLHSYKAIAFINGNPKRIRIVTINHPNPQKILKNKKINRQSLNLVKFMDKIKFAIPKGSLEKQLRVLL